METYSHGSLVKTEVFQSAKDDPGYTPSRSYCTFRGEATHRGTHRFFIMEKDYRPPPYSNPQMIQTTVNYPVQQPAYPPQAGLQAPPYQPPPYGFGATTITVQPRVVPVVTQIPVVGLTDVPGRIICPHCMTDVITETEYMSGLLAWLICGVVALFLCWPCCLIPFCVDACKDVKHTCPNCKNIIRLYKRM
ncbi:hypothetical protein QQF64_000533 [Cirrhinus molitorella]|uniref:LITAF domain-containing protein n=1 Tax=Cirrhinus molitorella TaxID=172907 RepID=A0ABR3NXG4_9TELE